MLRQRNIRSDEDAGEGIFIGEVEETEKFSKHKSSGQIEVGCWKYFTLGITFVTGEMSNEWDISILLIMILVFSDEHLFECPPACTDRRAPEGHARPE